MTTYSTLDDIREDIACLHEEISSLINQHKGTAETINSLVESVQKVSDAICAIQKDVDEIKATLQKDKAPFEGAL